MASKSYKFGKAIAGNLAIIGTALAVFAVIYSLWQAPQAAPKTSAQNKPQPTKTQDEGLDAAAREICKQFIERSGYRAIDWGESWNWTTTDNKDGTWSVVSRFVGMPPGGTTQNMTLVCIPKKMAGDQWSLDTLSRMQ